jgi:hypothetical protein
LEEEMKRFLTICAALALVLMPASASHATDYQYGWTISGSNLDPFISTGPPTGGLVTLYLWYQCSVKEGMSAAEFGLVSSNPGNVILALNVQNGFLNAGSATQPLLAVGSCPPGPVVAAELLVLVNAGAAEYCIVPSTANARNATVDCQPAPAEHPNKVTGFSTTGSAPTCDDRTPLLCNPVSVDATSWGEVKGLYR